MIAQTQTLRFLTDHNVPDSVGKALDELGHDVVRLRDVMAVNTSDPIVARAAIEDKRILVSWDRDFNRDLSLLEIARESGLSTTHLTLLFQRHTGKTPYAYVISRRLRHAVEKLRDTRMPIAEVALSCGFSDQQHMTRLFRLRLGTTPNAVRKTRS